MKKVVSLFTLFTALFFVGCAPVPPQNEQNTREEKLQIMTTFFPLYVFTKNVAGDVADTDVLLPPGVGPHEYQAKPGDIKRFGKADILVINGVQMEEFLDDMIKSAGKTDLQIVDTSKSISLIDYDPHIWLSPKNAIKQTEAIRDALMKADAKNAPAYQKNADAFIARLQNLDQEITQKVMTFKTKDFIAFHPAFTYFSRDYGLNTVAVIEESPGKEPTPQYLAHLIDLIRSKRVRAVFSEPQFSPKIVELIAEETGITVHELDPMETGEFRFDAYEIIMKKNLQALEAAFNS